MGRVIILGMHQWEKDKGVPFQMDSVLTREQMLFLIISSGRKGSLAGLFVCNEPHPVSSFCKVPRRNTLALSSGVL